MKQSKDILRDAVSAKLSYESIIKEALENQAIQGQIQQIIMAHQQKQTSEQIKQQLSQADETVGVAVASAAKIRKRKDASQSITDAQQ